MKSLFLAAALVCAGIGTSVHAKSEWINIAVSSTNMRLDVQAGSLEFSKTKGGTAIVVVIGKITHPITSRIELYKWYVSAIDCKREMGKVVSLNIDGVYQFENDFVFGSGSIATLMAEAICGAADYEIKKSNEKSL
jgi:hypothetical protein